MDICRPAGLVQEETERFNAAWSHKDADTPVTEFVLAAAQDAQQMYGSVFQKVNQQVSSWLCHCKPCWCLVNSEFCWHEQVTEHCEERGLLLEAVWRGLTSCFSDVLSRVRDHSAEIRLRYACTDSGSLNLHDCRELLPSALRHIPQNK